MKKHVSSFKAEPERNVADSSPLFLVSIQIQSSRSCLYSISKNKTSKRLTDDKKTQV